MKLYRYFFKQVLDFIVALLVLLLMLPVLLAAGIVLFIANKGNVFFIQERPGLHEKIFRIVKFKTMNDARDASGELLPDNKRLTVAGKIIRKTSIDELPQLFNVLKGDMSLVGPRPLLVEYLPLYSAEQKKRHEVRPGITGWAQINGRNGIDWQQRFRLDIWYVDNLSFLLDLKIILLTVYKVFRSEGINAASDVTMEKFTGTN